MPQCSVYIYIYIYIYIAKRPHVNKYVHMLIKKLRVRKDRTNEDRLLTGCGPHSPNRYPS